MAKEGPGSDRAELKKLLKLSADEPVSMAFALGADGKVVVKLHKMKQPRALEKGLKDDLDGAKNSRFGTVVLDPDDPKRVRFMVNKASGGIARKLVVALKGTGFSKVQIVTEDGETEDHEDEDQDDAPGSPGAGAPTSDGDPPADEGDAPSAPVAGPDPGQTGTPSAPPAPAPTPSPPPDPTLDPAALAQQLTQQLTALVKQMMGIIAGDPAQKPALVGLAGAVQASIKAGDFTQAQSGLGSLAAALGGGVGAAPPPAAAAPAGPDPATQQMLQKSHQAWAATRLKIDAEMQKLLKAVVSASDDDAFEKQFQTVVEPLVTTLDGSLSTLLQQAAAATDMTEHQNLMAQARSALAQYRAFVDSNPVISHLDDNPFVPLAIGKTLDATLSALSKIIH